MLRSAGGIRPKRPLRSRAGRRPGRGPARNGVGILGLSARDRVGTVQGPGGGIRHDPRGDGARNQVGCPGPPARDQVGKTAAGRGRGARDRVGTPGPAARDQVGPSERRCTKRSRDLPGAGGRTDRQVPRPPSGVPAGRRRPPPLRSGTGSAGSAGGERGGSSDPPCKASPVYKRRRGRPGRPEICASAWLWGLRPLRMCVRRDGKPLRP